MTNWTMGKIGYIKNYVNDLKNSTEVLIELGHVVIQNVTEFFDGYPTKDVIGWISVKKIHSCVNANRAFVSC